MKRKEGKSKKQARFLCILLTFVMLLGMLPMTALAADETTYITEVTITGVQTPVIGQPCSVDTIVITTNPANAYITEGTGAVYIYWYDDTDGVSTNQTDTFIDGHSYHLSVWLEPKEGYAFGFDYSSMYELKPYTGTATVNGKKAYSAETLSGSNTGLFVGSDGGIVPVEAPTTYGITVTNGRASIGTGSEITSASENDVITLTADTAPEGKTFDKWVVDEGSTAITLADMNSASTTFTMPAGAVSITAMYKDIQQSGGDNDPVYYTLTFDKNGGNGTMADVKVDKGSNYSLPACKFTAPAGKEFKAWEVDGGEKAVGDSITVNADTKVKALWKDKTSETYTPGSEMCTITFHFDEGVWTDPVTGDKKGSLVWYVDKGDTITLPSAPVREGYTFLYWKGSKYDPGDSYTVDGDHTFTAMWEKNPEPEIPHETPKPEAPKDLLKRLKGVYERDFVMNGGKPTVLPKAGVGGK